VAVVGVGRWGVNHVRVLSEIRRRAEGNLNIEEIKVVDTDLPRAKAVAEQYSLSGCTSDVGDLIREKFDAAIVAVPTMYHYKVASQLLPHMHVLVEKPIASTLEEAEKLVKLAEREGRILAVGHIERFNPVVPALKERIGKRLDSVKYLTSERLGPGPARGYTYNLGAAHDLLVHDVDVASYLLEDLPRSVYAYAVWEPGYPFETEITGLYYFEGGILANLRASWRTGPVLKRRVVTVQLEDEVLEADYILQSIRVEKGLAEHHSKGEYADIISTYTSRVVETWSMLGFRKEPLLLELQHFLQCVEEGRQPINNAEVGLNALKCVISALESAKAGQPVTIQF